MNKSSHKSHIGKVFHLGRYTCTVDDVIAEGGFAIVFRVRAQNGEVFALKRMYVNNEQDLKVCKREIQIASSLAHKNIIRYVDSSITLLSDGVYEVLLLLEFCRRTVMQLLLERQSTGLREAEVMRIFCDIVEAVARLHHSTTPVIHRDLKVENILIDSRGSFVLCDFGSATAKVLEPAKIGAARCEEELARYTTLTYRAPEMIDVYSGQPITTKADIWALGCMLFYLAFFQMPFGESTLAIQSGRFTFPAHAARSYSPAMLALIRYCLQTDANKRPDIYQVAACAFSIASRQNPVANLNHAETLSLEQLIAQFLEPDSAVSSNATAKPPLAEREQRTTASTSDPRVRSATAGQSAPAPNPNPNPNPAAGQAARPRPHAGGVASGNNPMFALPPPIVTVSASSNSGNAPRGSGTSISSAGTGNLPPQQPATSAVQLHRRIASDCGNVQQLQTQAQSGFHIRQTSAGNQGVPPGPQTSNVSATVSTNSLESAREQLTGLSFTEDADFGAEFDKLRMQTKQQPQPQTQTQARLMSQLSAPPAEKTQSVNAGAQRMASGYSNNSQVYGNAMLVQSPSVNVKSNAPPQTNSSSRPYANANSMTSGTQQVFQYRL